ncbi:MAG: hypothetical protein EXS58_03500 [Candidatus Latescibacteria bacterium]|nr:hypothetical protein [Candidatus Latescibacterota bacterium]
MRDYRAVLDIPEEGEPELIERTAVGAVLQSFYNGVENIFQTVAKRVDQEVPASADWHRKLLTQMAGGTETRLPLISPLTAERLEPYLGFRHLVRHAYSFTLEWSRMSGLVRELSSVWEQFQAEVRSFLDRHEESEDRRES